MKKGDEEEKHKEKCLVVGGGGIGKNWKRTRWRLYRKN